MMLGEGAVLAGMMLGAIAVFMIDRRFYVGGRLLVPRRRAGRDRAHPRRGGRVLRRPWRSRSATRSSGSSAWPSSRCGCPSGRSTRAIRSTSSRHAERRRPEPSRPEAAGRGSTGVTVWISQVRRRRAARTSALAPGRGRSMACAFAVKDNIDVAGLATTAACPSFAYMPERSATAVLRLEAAGALIVGKTNMDQFATGLVGTRSPYGACSSRVRPGARVGRVELGLGGRRGGRRSSRSRWAPTRRAPAACRPPSTGSSA